MTTGEENKENNCTWFDLESLILQSCPQSKVKPLYVMRQRTPLLSVTVCHLFLFSFLVCRSFHSVAPSQHPAPLRTGIFFLFLFFFFSFFFFFLFAGGKGRGYIVYTFGQIHLFCFSLHVHIKVQHQQLGFFRSIPTPNSTHQLCVRGSDPPHNSPAPPTLQCD